ncbi:MAG TPA: xanthine dehydrogenase family protein molybdopterin-binding subunit [Roseiflexaceae bacterium]|nr:xanthine dehydrogenase family protein molybdopterin-binding subunit [Roseiflexaceae bacterium]
MTQTDSTYRFLGKGHKLIEGMEKITGRARYAADLSLPGMLHARLVLSPYAHARIISIDTATARAMPGVVAVLTAEDLPTRERVINSRHSAVLAREKVLFRGQPVVAVLGETEAAARDAADAVLVEYEPLEPVVELTRALAEDAPAIWPDGLPEEGADLTAAHAAIAKETAEDEHLPPNVHEATHYRRGDVAQGFREAEVVIEEIYRTPIVHQGYLEPHASVAEPDPYRGGVTVYTSTQGQFSVRDEVARLLALPKSKVRVVPMTIGGGFGAKYGIIDPLVAALAVTVKRPVRLVLTRSEDFLSTTPSPAALIELKLGARTDGTLTALEARVVMDNGVFPFAIGGVVSNLMGGYYRCPNAHISVYEVLTHKPQGGAYRAPGAPSASFAIESAMDELARTLGMDPLELRLKNAAQAGDPTGNNDPWPDSSLTPVLQALARHPAWAARHDKGPNEGVGIAVGGWINGRSPAASICRVGSDGTVKVHVGSVDISGVNSSLVLIAAEILDVPPDQVELIQGDTRDGPFAGPSGGSQTTYSVSGAVAAAARAAKEKLLNVAADHFEASAADLELKDGYVQVKGFPDKREPIGEIAALAERRAAAGGPIIGEGRAAVPKSASGFVVHLAKVAVDPDTGQVTLKRYVAVQDVGFALNPTMVLGQIHGGSVQGIGWGLYEQMVYDEYGQLLTASFMDYTLPQFDQVPDIETVLVETPSPAGPFGARGVGEPPITAGAAAIANAVRDATGVRITQLPIRAEVLWRAMHQNGA